MYFHSLKYSTACFLKTISHNKKSPGPNPALIKGRGKISRRQDLALLPYSKQQIPSVRKNKK